MKKILIVDDDETMRDVMNTVLERSFEIQEAGSREEGLAAARSFLPDLILLDVMMETDMAGFEMSREIKNDPKTAHIKILMITSIDSTTGIDFKSAAGDPAWLPVDGYVNKPILPGNLLSQVEKLL